MSFYSADYMDVFYSNNCDLSSLNVCNWISEIQTLIQITARVLLIFLVRCGIYYTVK